MPDLKKFEWAAFFALFAVLGCAVVFLVPAADLRDFSRAETLATFAAIAVAIALLAMRLLPDRRPIAERFIYAVFLAGMPFIYVAAAVMQKAGSGIAVELLGVPLYAGLALYGYFRSFSLLGIGIVAHGVGWDLWHHGSSTYIAAWYPSACLLVDLAMGFLVLTQRRDQPAALRSIPVSGSGE